MLAKYPRVQRLPSAETIARLQQEDLQAVPSSVTVHEASITNLANSFQHSRKKPPTTTLGAPDKIHQGANDPFTAAPTTIDEIMKRPLRRSYLTKEELQQVQAEHNAHYPPSALQCPYIPQRTSTGMLGGESDTEDEMTPLHVAAGTGQVERSINPVFKPPNVYFL
jgi:hypothetical protein